MSGRKEKKIPILSREGKFHQRESSAKRPISYRNYDPSLHPHQQAIEYKRALNEVKLQRMFSKPFVGALEGHRDSIQIVRRDYQHLQYVLSGDMSGTIKLWNISHQECLWSMKSHRGIVRDVYKYTKDGEVHSYIWSIGDDEKIKCMRYEEDHEVVVEREIDTEGVLRSFDHHPCEFQFITSGKEVLLWDYHRPQPIHHFHWGCDLVTKVKYNPIESHLVGAVGNDRTVLFYDLRSKVPVHRLVMAMRSNQLSWHPREPSVFTIANDNGNCYSYDMRRMENALRVYKGHMGAVMDCDYHPTGKQLVTGGYDQTIRIYDVFGHEQKSKDVYHTKRMQKVMNVCYTQDGKYIVCGSEDMNVRIWKGRASDTLKVMKKVEVDQRHYAQSLIDKYEHIPEIRRIHKRRIVPKYLYNGRMRMQEHERAEERKERMRIKHSKPGSYKPKSLKGKDVMEYE